MDNYNQFTISISLEKYGIKNAQDIIYNPSFEFLYNEELNLALETNGIQHYIEHPKFFHKYGGFKEQQERDKYKLKFCLDNNINLIIMENDYTIYEEKLYVDKVLKDNNFYVDYTESGGWGGNDCICANNFFEVWKKK